MKKSLIKKYAALVARVGVNIRRGQPVIIAADVDQRAFVVTLTEECYKAGASRVELDWSCPQKTKLDYRHRTLKSLSTLSEWQIAKQKERAEELPCFIRVLSEAPDALKGIDQNKVQKARMATYPLIKPYVDAMENKYQWCVCAVPSYEWAKAVYPGERKSRAYELLWQAILKTVRITEDNDPVAEWQAHSQALAKRSEWLNSQHFEYVEYKSSNGTDFRAGLIPQGRWSGGGDVTALGNNYVANMPTEEIFITPKRGMAEGKLVSTMPLSTNGQIIRDFWIRFEDGRAVEWDAAEGKTTLDKLLTIDEGAPYLGELALVPYGGLIQSTGLLFLNTLFDENASCHIAFGAGYGDTVEGFDKLSQDELKAMGVNDSMVHVDFMIGAPDLAITGWRDGKPTPIFRDGVWAE